LIVSGVHGFRREQAIEAARCVLRAGGWCVLEVCLDVPQQRWEARLVMFDLAPEQIAGVVQDEIELEPGLDVRLVGCDRRQLRPVAAMGAHLVYVAPTLELAESLPVPAR
jgi:hypothetical protein